MINMLYRRRLLMQEMTDDIDPSENELVYPVNLVFKNTNTAFVYFLPWTEIENFLGKSVTVHFEILAKIKNTNESNTARPTNSGSLIVYRPTWDPVSTYNLSQEPDEDGYYTQYISVDKQYTFPTSAISGIAGIFASRQNYVQGSLVGTVTITLVP